MILDLLYTFPELIEFDEDLLFFDRLLLFLSFPKHSLQQKLIKFLESQGVNAMETVGKEFDVRYHDALLQVQRDDVPPHTIVEEVEKGYFLGDRVIRHAKVVVSTSPTGDSGEPVPAPSSGDEKNQPEGN